MSKDTIYRQDAIDAVEESRRLNHHQDGKEACAHEYEHRHFLKILMDLPSAQPEQRWIPTSKKLPEPRIDVWCDSDMGQMVGYYEEHVKTWYGRDDLELMVTAWMPLPEPYREEGDK